MWSTVPRPAFVSARELGATAIVVTPLSSNARGGPLGTRALACVNGHRVLPTGGHEFPHWWPSFLPAGGHESPHQQIDWLLVC